ncbi:MAG TPA: HAD family hydrolase [Actinophytocola sp.]|uniref:HAD family hydrolase n=1 Tax=Actinophytocola sp. TaxID=1872138 RepID=UPI002DB7EC38|nr:HAD family hydrolase [Actinophytocola sp.]HEU5470171.1 HAD family hydrolase [Actinophytocola sp.]
MTSALVPVHVHDHPPEDAHLLTPIQAVCLDIDDTLVDFTTSARRALSSMIGRDDLWPIWQRTTEEHVKKVVAGEMDSDTMRRARTKAFLAELGTPLDDDVVDELEARRYAEMTGDWRLFDDVVPCLDWLRAAGLKVAAVTNASGPQQRAKLIALGIARFFDTIVIAGELGAAKPDPVIFQTACQQLHVSADETLHVGDRLDTDAVGARDAGLHGVWLHRRGPLPTPDAGVHVIETLSDLPALIVSEYLTPTATAPAAVPTQRPPDPVSGPPRAWSTISGRHSEQ